MAIKCINLGIFNWDFLCGKNIELFNKMSLNNVYMSEWSQWGYFDIKTPRNPNIFHNLQSVRRGERVNLFYNFGEGIGRNLWHRYQLSEGWSSWSQVDGRGDIEHTANFRAYTNSDGRIEVFAVSLVDRSLIHIYQKEQGWSNWGSLGGKLLGYMSGALNTSDETLQIFAKSAGFDSFPSHSVVYKRQKPKAEGGGWSDWEGLGNSMWTRTRTEVGRNSDGRLEIFVINKNGALEHRWQEGPGSGNWTDWREMGQGMKFVNVINNRTDGKGKLYLFTSQDNVIKYKRQLPEGGWSDWTSLGGVGNRLHKPVLIGEDDRIQLYSYSRVGSKIEYITQRSHGSADWSEWKSIPNDGLPSSPGEFEPIANRFKKVDVFTESDLNDERRVFHTFQF